MKQPWPDQKGFTLIEVIIALVVGGLLAVMIATFVGSSFTSAGGPVNNLRDTLALYSVMEKIQTDYDHNQSLDLAGLKAKISNAESNASVYGAFHILYNDYVECNPAVSTTFSGSAGSTMLLVTISDPQNFGIKTTALLVE